MEKEAQDIQERILKLNADRELLQQAETLAASIKKGEVDEDSVRTILDQIRGEDEVRKKCVVELEGILSAGLPPSTDETPPEQPDTKNKPKKKPKPKKTALEEMVGDMQKKAKKPENNRATLKNNLATLEQKKEAKDRELEEMRTRLG